MRNDFKMMVSKQLTISMKTQNDNKIKGSCSTNQQNITLHVKHDHQYCRNFKSLNIIWCIVCFNYIYWDTRYQIRVITKLPNFEQSYKGKVKTHNYINRNTSSMLNAKHFEIAYALHHLYIMYSNVKTPSDVT